jgi:hypothetical protein
MDEEQSDPPWSTTTVVATTQEQDERRRTRLREDLAAVLTWLRETVGPLAWSGISLRMALQPGPSPASIATRISAVLVDLDPAVQRTLLGMLDEMVDDLVMSRGHRRLARAEVIALEALREALARV